MIKKKNILGICGSASRNSANLAILKIIAELGKPDFNFEILDDLTELPHFKPELTDKGVPEKIVELRNKIAKADAVIFCTPEYVFSIPSGLKNLIEWCVSTTVFSDKQIGLITASASGKKGHEELKLIMETVRANFTEETALLIQGVKGKVDREGKILDEKTGIELEKFIQSFKNLTEKPANKIGL